MNSFAGLNRPHGRMFETLCLMVQCKRSAGSKTQSLCNSWIILKSTRKNTSTSPYKVVTICPICFFRLMIRLQWRPDLRQLWYGIVFDSFVQWVIASHLFISHSGCFHAPGPDKPAQTVSLLSITVMTVIAIWIWSNVCWSINALCGGCLVLFLEFGKNNTIHKVGIWKIPVFCQALNDWKVGSRFFHVSSRFTICDSFWLDLILDFVRIVPSWNPWNVFKGVLAYSLLALVWERSLL